jgi:phosphate transport system permease protein
MSAAREPSSPAPCPQRRHALTAASDGTDPFAILDQLTALPDSASPLTASGNLRRRSAINRLVEIVATSSALLAVAVLGIVAYSVAQRGGSALSFSFLVQGPPPFGGSTGGIAPAIVGTALLVAVAAALAMPLGILIAIYLTEFAGQRAVRAIRLVLDLLNGLPTIVIGLFVFGLLVVGHHQSGLAGAVALAIIMLPLIARASQEMLLLVPHSMREAAQALGVSRWRVVRGILLPSAFGGILTGTLLAVARASGETAPLIFTCSIFGNATTIDLFGQALPNIPVSIFQLSEQADPSGFARAWGAAFVLLLFILVTNVGARSLLTRSRSRLS